MIFCLNFLKENNINKKYLINEFFDVNFLETQDNSLVLTSSTTPSKKKA